MKFDVIVVGGGLVGAATALSLERAGLHVCLLEGGEAPKGGWPAEDWDVRVYAINSAAAGFLGGFGAWRRLDFSRVQAVSAMRIFGDDRLNRLDFSAYQAGVPELAFILESRNLALALWQTLAESTVTLMTQARPVALTFQADEACLALADGSRLSAALVVGADGRDSWVRKQAGLDQEPTPYRQQGVVANFTIERPHCGVAHQWFTPEGILAWLPLPGQRMSMVWSANDRKAEKLMALSPRALCDAVAAAGGRLWGDFGLITPPAAFALRRLTLKSLVRPRLALVGDAAHNVHPLAGQGVNLGFGDVASLYRVLAGRDRREDIGGEAILSRYQRARKEDILLMQLVTGGLKELFTNRNPLLALGRNFGLGAVNRIHPLKDLLIRHALGPISVS